MRNIRFQKVTNEPRLDLDFAFTGLLADLEQRVSTLPRVSNDPPNLRVASIFDTTTSDDYTWVMGTSRPRYDSHIS